MWRGRAKVLAIWILAFAVTAAVMCIFLLKHDSLAEQVFGILDKKLESDGSVSDTGLQELWALGPRIIPHLAAQARYRDTLLTKAYGYCRQKLPPGGLLPMPADRTRMRVAAMRTIADLGPLAARGSARAVIEGLSDSSREVQRQAVRAVEWLVPESPNALAAFTGRLTDTNNPLPTMFSLMPGEYIWPRAPTLIPLWMNLLGNVDEAHQAAIALRYTGSNAAPAVPALIETLDQGVAGSWPDPDSARSYQSRGNKVRADDQSVNHNRAMSAQALGAIGVASPEVMAALARAWNDRSAWVRANAAEAVAALGPVMTNRLSELVAGLRDRDNRALAQKLAAFAQIGPAAREALPTLEECADVARLPGWIDDPNQRVVTMTVEDIATAAKMAICRIDPERGRVFLPEFVGGIGRWWPPVKFLKEVPLLSNEVIRGVEPLLQATNTPFRQSIAAYVILGQSRNHEEAIAVLERNMTNGTINDRLLAGRLLFESAGRTDHLCQILEEALARPESHLGQGAAEVAGKMGAAALPLVPALKRALWHKDKFVRERAGMVLRKLAPEQMPIKDGG